VLDTIEGEPQVPAALLGRPNVILTPHVAFASRQAVEELCRRAATEVVRGRSPVSGWNALCCPEGRYECFAWYGAMLESEWRRSAVPLPVPVVLAALAP
jgi:hypothetical protein